jgi:hypothetical protein
MPEARIKSAPQENSSRAVGKDKHSPKKTKNAILETKKGKY